MLGVDLIEFIENWEFLIKKKKFVGVGEAENWEVKVCGFLEFGGKFDENYRDLRKVWAKIKRIKRKRKWWELRI